MLSLFRRIGVVLFMATYKISWHDSEMPRNASGEREEGRQAAALHGRSLARSLAVAETQIDDCFA